VLSSQRVAANEALFDAAKGKDREKGNSVNPLVQDEKKLVPSVTRAFSIGREMYVYLQAYNPQSASAQPVNNTEAHPIYAFVSFYQNGAKIFETAPIAAVPGAASRIGIVPLSFAFSVDHLTPGEYDCQVTVLAPESQKSTYWRAPILLVP
jgi:hypothetical protein